MHNMMDYEKEHLEMLRSGLSECTILLKKNGQFPLASPCKIAAYGSGVRHTIKGGTGSGEVNSRHFITVEQGLKDAGFTITTSGWLDAYDQILEQAHIQFIKDIKKRARQKRTMAVFEGMGAVMSEPEYDLPMDAPGDAAIYVLSRISGEGNDRNVAPGDYLLNETEIRDILALNRRFQKFILVLNVGAPVDLTPVLEADNILLLSQLGVETGKTLADILLGNAYPSGKLATTWAKAENYPNVGTFAELNDTRYQEGIYVGYRWFDAAKKESTFPFGFGLGYTDFQITAGVVTTEKSCITASATVQNTGSHPGKEVVQLYLSCPQGKLDKPCKQLVAFGKTRELAPGESQTLKLTFDLRDSASYDEEAAAYLLERGNYIVHIGTSATSINSVAALHLPETVIIRQVRNLLGTPDFIDWKPDHVDKSYDLPIIELHPADFPAETVNYDLNIPIAPEIAALPDDNLLRMNMGAFNPKGGFASVIGSASMTVAGAAGESSHVFGDPIIMADGPAGVRISAQYYTDEKGVHAFGATIPATILEFMPWPLNKLMGGSPKLPKGVTLQEQYCTAMPIGTALAQSWNTEYAVLCGDMVGAEMERFGIHLWLAPALNIHRSPLCGRNFEYFSEDPYISGLFAAALTRGVQSHPGRGVTIKHYAANNQETNRYLSNSIVSERAMREIYLRGFEWCVRSAAPKAVMTSYNLLNGIHTSESHGLCTDILRCEYRFGGICMTDWLVEGLSGSRKAIYTVPNPAKIAAAGGDLFMPGGKNDYARLKKGYETGIVTKQQLQRNATRILQMTRKLRSDQE